jgi:hypothetical protein
MPDIPQRRKGDRTDKQAEKSRKLLDNRGMAVEDTASC